ncbi:MAG: hypothetical protein ABSH29_03085 [Acidimicrobiales bacterium]|jgi:hypothetical protein
MRELLAQPVGYGLQPRFEEVAHASEEALGDRFPKKCQELGVVISVGPLHLDPSHQTLTVAEAPNIETVNRALRERGLAHFNDIETFSRPRCPNSWVEWRRFSASSTE